MEHVVLGALVREGRVLLVHRRPDKRAYPDVWDLPGGLLEAGETGLGALARKLHEELGVHVETSSTPYLSRVIVDGPDGPAVLTAWLVRDWQGTPENRAPDEHDDVGWFGLGDLPPPVRGPMRTALVSALRTNVP